MPPRSLHVLVVDDNALVRSLLVECLRLDGHTVEVAADSREGWTRFRAGRFDAVVTDWQMPEMAGDALALAIKRAAPATPVVMLSGSAADLRAARGLPPGVDVLVGKPLSLAGLRAALAEAMVRGA